MWGKVSLAGCKCFIRHCIFKRKSLPASLNADSTAAALVRYATFHQVKNWLVERRKRSFHYGEMFLTRVFNGVMEEEEEKNGKENRKKAGQSLNETEANVRRLFEVECRWKKSLRTTSNIPELIQFVISCRVLLTIFEQKKNTHVHWIKGSEKRLSNQGHTCYCPSAYVEIIASLFLFDKKIFSVLETSTLSLIATTLSSIQLCVFVLLCIPRWLTRQSGGRY